MDLTTSGHYRNVGYYYLYHTVPGFISGFGFGDAGNAAAASGPNYLFQIANLTRDPYIQYLAHNLKEKHPNSFFLRSGTFFLMIRSLKRKILLISKLLTTGKSAEALAYFPFRKYGLFSSVSDSSRGLSYIMSAQYTRLNSGKTVL